MKTLSRHDTPRAAALRAAALMTLKKIDALDASAFPSDVLVDYYATLHKLFEALAHYRGMRFRGEGAHRELIEYICATLAFSFEERVFLQELREQRNRIEYDDETVAPLYLQENAKRIRAIIAKVKR